jgi:hypothetical protein
VAIPKIKTFPRRIGRGNLLIALLAAWASTTHGFAQGPPPDPATAGKLLLIVPGVQIANATLPKVAKFIHKESRILDATHKGLRVLVLREKDFGQNIPEPDAGHQINMAYNSIGLGELIHYSGYLFNRKVLILKNTVFFVPFDADISRLPRKFVR